MVAERLQSGCRELGLERRGRGLSFAIAIVQRHRRAAAGDDDVHQQREVAAPADLHPERLAGAAGNLHQRQRDGGGHERHDHEHDHKDQHVPHDDPAPGPRRIRHPTGGKPPDHDRRRHPRRVVRELQRQRRAEIDPFALRHPEHLGDIDGGEEIQNPMASAQCHRVIANMTAAQADTRLNTNVIGVSWPFGAIPTTLIVMVLPSAEMLLTPLLFTRPPTLAMMFTEESSMMVSE